MNFAIGRKFGQSTSRSTTVTYVILTKKLQFTKYFNQHGDLKFLLIPLKQRSFLDLNFGKLMSQKKNKDKSVGRKRALKEVL